MLPPETPREFFRDYMPARFAQFRSALEGCSSSGSMAFEILGDSEQYAFRIAGGELIVSEGTPADLLLRIAVARADFAPIVVAAAGRTERLGAGPEHQLLAFKVLIAEPDRLAVLKTVPGTLSIVLGDGSVKRAVHLAIGGAAPNPEAAQCRIEGALGDFLGVVSGQANPFQLLMDGKLRITGNMQIPMVLAGLMA